jgi:hypothetical protein
VSDDPIPWLTDDHRNLLAHLCTIVIQAQLTPARAYADISDALAAIADRGEVTLRGNDTGVEVVIAGLVIVEAPRDWLDFHAGIHATRAMN